MAASPDLDHALFTVPFSYCTDFTELADRCEHFIEALLEPVPANLIESLTVDDIPATIPVFEPEADSLTGWCQTLLQVLMSGSLAAEQERKISDLLCELVSFFAQTLKAPR